MYGTGAVPGETGVADGSFLPSNVSWDSRYEAVETINRSTIKYMEELEGELSSMLGYKKPENEETEKESLKSRTDPECGYIHQARNIRKHLKEPPCEYREIGLDGRYDIGVAHRGLELLGINGYTAIWEYQNNAMKKRVLL